MSLRIIPLAVVRLLKVRTDTAGYTQSEQPVPGSPFQARVYRKPEITVKRLEAAGGVASIDAVRAVSFLDPAAPVAVNDLCLLPTGEQAKIIRVRRYDDRVQCDLETGAE